MRTLKMNKAKVLTRPPVAEPDAAIPIARERFLLKYVDSSDIVGQNWRPLPIPVQIPWARNNCQYFVERDVMKIPNV